MEELLLSAAEYSRLKKSVKYIESRFGVHVNSPANNTRREVMAPSDVFMLTVTGNEKNLEPAMRHIKALIFSERKQHFCFPSELKNVFGNSVWIQILEKLHCVSIKTVSSGDLFVSGSKTAVASTISAMAQLVQNFESNHVTDQNDSQYLTTEIANALCHTNSENVIHQISDLPSNVKKTLLSWIKESREDDNLEQSVVILDSSDMKDQSVIILDSSTVNEEAPVITISDSDEDVVDITTSTIKHMHRPKRKKNNQKDILQLYKRTVTFNQAMCTLKDCSKNSDCASNSGCASQTCKKSAKSVSCKPMEPVAAEDFIPLNNVVKINKVDVLKAVPAAPSEPIEDLPPRVLRPIVIDGSNVAVLHGKPQKVFSCRGILLSIEYFLKRGHTRVTAFVPQFRRYPNCKNVVDRQILEELSEKQQVVFTPSRRVEGKSYSCYDDRFIVDLATRTGGVILSNDNFRDIMEENSEWKKTIQERLLQFVFFEDELMIPHDPLGRTGPRLDEFLSFPNSS